MLEVVNDRRQVGDYFFALWSFALYFSVFHIIHTFFLNLHVFFVLRFLTSYPLKHVKGFELEAEHLRFWIFNQRVLFNPILGFQVHLFSWGLAFEYSEERGSQASSGFTFYLTLQRSDRIKFIMPGKFYCNCDSTSAWLALIIECTTQCACLEQT